MVWPSLKSQLDHRDFQKLDILFGQAVLYTRESKKSILLF